MRGPSRTQGNAPEAEIDPEPRAYTHSFGVLDW